MKGTADIAFTFQIVSEAPVPRFLGLTTAERNTRVARLATGRGDREASVAHAATLTVPPGVVITASLFAALPPPAGVWHLVWNRSRPPIVWRGAGAAATDVCSVRQLPDGAALDVSTAAARRRSAWRLLRAAGKPTDGWMSRHLNRKISRVGSYLLAALGVTPTAATLLVLAIGLASAWYLAQTSRLTMLAGGFLFWAASVADGLDGEIARLTLSESDRGQQLDTLADDFTYAACCAGAMIGWWRQGVGPAGMVLMIGVAVGLPAMVLWAIAIVRRASPGPRPYLVATTPIEYGVIDAARATGRPALRLMASVFQVFRRDVFSLVFFAVSCTTDRRIVYPAIVAAGLLVAAVALVVYRRDIEQAMRVRLSA